MGSTGVLGARREIVKSARGAGSDAEKGLGQVSIGNKEKMD